MSINFETIAFFVNGLYITINCAEFVQNRDGKSFETSLSICRFFLSSIEAAVEHIRRGSVDDILKGLPPTKVS